MDVISEPIPAGDVNLLSSNNSKIAVENNMIYVVWEDTSNLNGAGTDSDIFYRHYNGASWSKLQVISESKTGKNINLGESYEPDIAVENGNVYIVWYDDNNTNLSGSDYDIFYRANLTGNGWEDIQVISEPAIMQDINTGWSISPEIVVENGSVHVCWQDDSNFNNAAVDWDIFYRSNLTGLGWGSIQIVSEPVQGSDINKGESRAPDIAIDKGELYLVWYDDNNTYNAGTDNDILYRSNLTGSGWSAIAVLSEPLQGSDINKGDSKFPAITAEDGQIHLAWHDNNNTNGASADYDILYKYFNGNTWTAVQVISEPVAGADINTGGSLYPSLDVDQGSVYIAWHDTNNTTSAGQDMDIFYRTKNSGTSWNEITVISEPVEGSDQNTGKSIQPNIVVKYGKTHIVWTDNNNTNYAGTDRDILYRSTFNGPTLKNGNVSPLTGYSSTYFNFSVEYQDPDNQPPLYIKVSLSGTNYTMVEADSSDVSYFNGKVYYYNTTLGLGSGYNFSFFTTDGTYSAETAVIEAPDVVNFQPRITTVNNETAYEDTNYEVQYEFEDQDLGQTHMWTFNSNAKSWLSFNPTTAILQGIPEDEDVGEYWVNITVSDSLGAANWTYFTLTVINVNDPPEIEVIGNLTAIEDEDYQISIKTTDVDTSQIEINLSIKTNASWLTKINDTSLNTTFSGTPNNDDVGEYYINITANDTEGGVNYDERVLKVLNVNDPPVIQTQDVINAWPDQLYSVLYEVEDIDHDLQFLTWSFETKAGNWLKMNLSTGWLNGTPEESHIGSYWVNVSVYDIEGGVDFHNFTLTVNLPPNQSPILDTTGINITAVAGQLYVQKINVSDDRTLVPDLEWSLVTNAGWLAFNEATQELQGTPGDNEVGAFWVNLSVNDTDGGLSFHNFTITVDPSPNTAPELTEGKVSPEQGDIDTKFTFSVYYYDADGDPPGQVKVVIDGEEYDMSLDSGTAANGTYVYKTKLSKGAHSFYFTATDGNKTAMGGDTSTPISSSTSRETSEIEDVSEGIDWILILLIIIIIILIIAIIGVALYRSKKPRADEMEIPPDDFDEEPFEEPEEYEDEEDEYYEDEDEVEEVEEVEDEFEFEFEEDLEAPEEEFEIEFDEDEYEYEDEDEDEPEEWDFEE